MLRTELEQWIQSGNLRRAASSLVVAYGSDVLATCTAMVRDRTAAEDLTQDIFSDAIRGLSSFRGDAAPRTWLLSIARHRCIDYLRARKRDPWGGALDDNAPDPDEHPDNAAFGSEWLADRSLVLRALDALPEGDRALVVLRFKNGLDYDELANAFGLREGTVRMRVSRALARMREVLETDAPRVPSFGYAPSYGFAPPPAPGAAPGGAPAPSPPLAAAPGGAPPPPPAAASGGAPAPSPPLAAAPAPAMSAPARAPLRAPFGAPVPATAASRGGAPAPAPPPASWWSRIVAWARGEAAAPAAPVGALGSTLAAADPGRTSDALAARLGALVDTLPG